MSDRGHTFGCVDATGQVSAAFAKVEGPENKVYRQGRPRGGSWLYWDSSSERLGYGMANMTLIGPIGIIVSLLLLWQRRCILLRRQVRW
jgi:hypothetical protein